MSKERLQKVLAAAGVASRRACETLILDGRVSVNGRTVNDIPVFVDVETDEIRVDGKKITRPRKVYLLLNKPVGVLSTASDPAGRKTVIDLVGPVGMRLFPVGRLDKDSQGLILITNDGALTKHLTHPRHRVERVYVAHVAGRVDGETVKKLTTGVWLAEGKARAKQVKIVRRAAGRSVLEITLTEGKNRQIRRMLAKLALPVKKLVRVRFGSLVLKGVKTGHFRALTAREVGQLKTLVKSA